MGFIRNIGEMFLVNVKSKLEQNQDLRELVKQSVDLVADIVIDARDALFDESKPGGTKSPKAKRSPNNHPGKSKRPGRKRSLPNVLCKVAGCDQLITHREGFCNRHYQQARRGTIDSNGQRIV